jgi:hypothetical protein
MMIDFHHRELFVKKFPIDQKIVRKELYDFVMEKMYDENEINQSLVMMIVTKVEKSI